MRYLVLIAMTLYMVSCGGEPIECNIEGINCSRTQEHELRLDRLEREKPVTVVGPAGQPGVDGKDGMDGRDGVDGVDGTDGTDGIDGQDGEDAIISIIDPCLPGGERLFVLDSCIAVYFETGNSRFLTCLEDGKYITTDADQCKFEIKDGEYVIQ